MDDRFIPIRTAAKEAGVSLDTLRRRIEEGGIATYRRPLDKRFRLVRESDLVRLTAPQLISEATNRASVA